MQVIIETDEAASLMTVVTSYVIDHGGLSQDGKQRLRQWRTGHADGTVEMDALSVAMNQALGMHLDERTNRLVKKKGRYARSKDAV